MVDPESVLKELKTRMPSANLDNTIAQMTKRSKTPSGVTFSPQRSNRWVLAAMLIITLLAGVAIGRYVVPQNSFVVNEGRTDDGRTDPENENKNERRENVKSENPSLNDATIVKNSAQPEPLLESEIEDLRSIENSITVSIKKQDSLSPATFDIENVTSLNQLKYH